MEAGNHPSATGEDGRAALDVAEAAVVSLQESGAVKKAGGGYELV